MPPTTKAKPIELLRLGNPWLVGKNVNRVVPVYAIANVVAPDFERSDRVQAVKDLAFDAGAAIDSALGGDVAVSAIDFLDLEKTTYGLLSPDRRIFADHRNGGASDIGALFPLVGGLVTPAASDDGLGRKVRELLMRHDSDWQSRMASLMAPTHVSDPATAYACRLLGGTAGTPNPQPQPRRSRALKGIDSACASFLDNLLRVESGDSRIAAIRRFTIGVYFVALMRMVAGVVQDAGRRIPSVFVYCGLPPGASSSPLVRAASKSFIDWASESHNATATQLSAAIASAPVLPKTKKAERVRQQVHGLLSDRLSQKVLSATLDALGEHLQTNNPSPSWCLQIMASPTVGFSKGELARRIRSLGANIGFAGPDRGLLPRLMIDTPLLGVLARGAIGHGSLPFDEFVSKLHSMFGLVVGVGADDSVAETLGDLGSDGFDAYELLLDNQELLRERLLRTGLARAYSDSHTEVFGYA